MVRYIRYFIAAVIGLFFVLPAFASEWADCSSSDSLCSPNFTIQLDDFSLAWELIGWTAKETVNNTIGRIIQMMMILFWVVSLFIMTIGAGYMIIYHWDDELLSRWKGIFSAGIISLIIALSAYYIVDLVWYLLYR